MSGTIAAIVSLGLVLYLARSRVIRSSIAVPSLGLAIALALTQFQSPDRRYALLANRSELADWFRYWWVAARFVDDEPRSHRIAITGGAMQDSDNWLMYYFMGGNLQNTLHYIPVSTGGEFLPFGPGTERQDDGNVEAWISRIHGSGISHVMSFAPGSIEIAWMNAHPETFARLTGHEDQWALFRVLPGHDRE